MNEQQLKDFLERLASGTYTNEEYALFTKWVENSTREEYEQMIAFWEQLIDSREMYEAVSPELIENIERGLDRIDERKIKIRYLWPRIAVAASVLIILSFGGYFLLHKKQMPQIAQNQRHDIAPGHNQATLTLANGQKIILTKGLSGKLATQGNMLIAVKAGDAITYTAEKENAVTGGKVVYNTLSTVRGQESPYPLVLADGTKVWLNAESSITFPTAFDGIERAVKITGEAYFEVVHNASHPFKVEVKGQTIEDVGTAFNINAYDDEPAIKTTLINGSIRINQATTLHPGQVAIQQGSAMKVQNVDTEGAIAWKNGYFLFDHESLESIMRKISRWYNVDIEYGPGQHINDGFLGSMTRYANVSQVLNVLETAGKVKFKIEGKKIIVTQK